MRRLILGLLLCAISAQPKAWVREVDDLVHDSDLIVVGTLDGISRRPGLGAFHDTGRITVSKVLWGKASVGQKLKLRWEHSYLDYMHHFPFAWVRCGRLDYRWAKRMEGVWFLKVIEPGHVRADDHGRWVEPHCVTEVMAKIRASVHVPQWRYEPDDPVRVSLVFRNTAPEAQQFPAPGAAVTVRTRNEFTSDGAVPINASRALAEANLSPITVAPGGEGRIGVSLRDLFGQFSGCYTVQLSFPGNEVSGAGHFCINRQ